MGLNLKWPSNKPKDSPTTCRFDWGFLIHNLRNYVGVMAANAEQLTADTTDAASQARLIQKAAAAAMKELEDFAALAYPLELTLTQLNLADWLRETVAAHAISGKAGISIEWRLDPAVGMLSFDPLLLGRAVQAILDNCLEAMPDGGTLKIILEQTPTGPKLTLGNTGEAIPEDMLEQVGEPFYTNKPKKRGLGLAMARKVMEAHDGRLAVQNAREAGVEIVFALPERRQ